MSSTFGIVKFGFGASGNGIPASLLMIFSFARVLGLNDLKIVESGRPLV
jgi:hypothetical protein